MKKTLLTAALVAGFASAAHAETSVTLYGVVDGGVGYTNVKTNYDASRYYNGAYVSSISATGKDRGFGVKSGVQSGNRWGLKGTEDLGNGTSAIFQLESGFNLGNGEHLQEGRLFGRKAILGLTGESWGTVTLGRQYNVGDDFLAPIDPFGTGFGQAAVTNTAGVSWSGRYDSSVKYLSPNFSGFQVGLAWAGTNNKSDYDVTVSTPGGWASESSRTKQNDNLFNLGVAYNNGPIQAALVWDHQNQKDRFSWSEADSSGYSDSGSGSNKSTVDAWNLGFAYDFDVVKLHLGIGQQRDGLIRDSDDSSGLLNSVAGGTAADEVSWLPNVVGPTRTLLNDFYGEGYKQTHWMVGLSAPVSEAGKVLFSYQGAHGKNSDSGLGFGGAYSWNAKSRTNIFSLGYTHNLSKRTNLYALASYGTYKVTGNGSIVYASGNVSSADGRIKTKATQINVGLRHRF